MPEATTSERAALEQQRRRAFLDQIPENFCAHCTSVVYEEDTECFFCGTERPESDWPPIGLAGDPWLGSVLAERYLITRRVATSAKARVYIADSRIIPRSFAIKIMNVTGGPNLDEEGLRKRLRHEVEALGTLRNPHIVSFYDVFDARANHVAFVMDLIQGVTLTELLREEGPLPLPRAFELMRQIATGLFEAHQRHLIHRDLKPANVMVERLPIGDDFVHILDFGVMWVRGTASSTGAFDEMPVFASPEQISGEPTDHRSDLYSLGALAFFMLTGKPPFDPSKVADPEMILIDPPPALEDVMGTEFPAQVEALVSRLLEKEPDRRPNDVGAVLEWIAEISTELSLASDADEYESAYPTAEEDSSSEAEEAPSSSATAFGMVPTLNEKSSPVVHLEPADLSAVSEAAVDVAGSQPELMACRGEGYGFVLDGAVVWEGAFAGIEPAELDPDLDYISLAMSETRALLGTSDGRIIVAKPGQKAVTAFQDPRQAPINAVAMVAAADSMIAGSDSGRLYMSREEDFVRMGGGTDSISALCLSDKGDQFAVARGATIQVLSIGASNMSAFPTPLDETVISMAFSSDAYLVAVLTVKGSVVLESVHTGQEFMRLDTGDPELRAVTFSKDNHLMGLFRDGARVVLRKLT